jgi:molybdopterin molybdotransferase
MNSDKMLTPEQAQQIVLDHIRPLGVERVALMDALERILAADVRARRDNPPCDNSAMDGYAVRHQDIAAATAAQPAVLEMIEEIPAGRVGQKTVGPRQTSRIMTGAPVPQGADTVIPVEDTRAQDNRIEILEADEREANVRHRGEDIQAGAVVLSAGTLCGTGELGILAALQCGFVPVQRRPTLAILSTGDELVEIDEPLEPGKIVNSNTYALAALARAHGAVPVMLPIARDSEEDIRRAVEGALQADFVLSSGGVSVGEYDYIRKVLDDMGGQFKFWRVAMKPGKPLFFCLIQDKPYFGLPGNPVSSMMSFLQFVRPAIRKATAFPADDLLLPTTRGVVENSIYNDGNRRNYLRARLRLADGRLHASTRAGQGSHMLTSMLGANGIVVLEPEQKVEPGDEVNLQIIERVF